ncbi:MULTISPECIES: glycine betaine ABC transporter substrate-binding protein [unclassified Streptomyces]|uniref:glycine betaine ABC transporter substrate-binding protein n=1 Tax=unclassified Streptomyces TaxID=2593676 RepID=UPI002DDBCDD3|nr:glycine betaine ABC transporter substrate-binding protein [Streptomyces sp. NBC_00243]WRZ17600.1 glycine betaine ABC transporter substrate-binding protein [Streptomyces sp. NBC_00243]
MSMSLPRSARTSALLASAAATVLLASGCGGDTQAATGSAGDELDGATLTVGSKDFTENIVLGQITMKVLQAHGAEVEDKTNIKGSVTTRQALTSGDIDLYWEYTGTGWISYLEHTTPIADATKQYEDVRDEDLKKNKIVWLKPAPLNNTYALALREDTAQELGLTKLSDLAALAESDPSKATFCLESEFSTRDDGWPGVKKTYGIDVPDDNIKMLDTGVIYNETGEGKTCTFGEVFTTDGRIESLKLKVLEDDKHFFPVYNASLTLPESIADKYPEIAEIMAPVTAKLTDATLQKLNADVDVDGLTPEEAAEDWLDSEGLLN